MEPYFALSLKYAGVDFDSNIAWILLNGSKYLGGRKSSVDDATSYGLHSPGSNPCTGEFPHSPGHSGPYPGPSTKDTGFLFPE
jgi:hypothetical protein